LTDDFGGDALHQLVGVLQQVDEAHDAAELLQRHADALARTQLPQNLQRADLHATAIRRCLSSTQFNQKLCMHRVK